MPRARKIHPPKEAEAIDRAIEEQVRPMRGWETFVRAARATGASEYPMDRQAVDYSFGDIEIEIGQDDYLPIREISDFLPAERIDSAEVLIQAMRQAVDRRLGRRRAG